MTNHKDTKQRIWGTLVAVMLWTLSLALPVHQGALGYHMLIVSAAYLAVPWLASNIIFFVLAFRNLSGRPNYGLAEWFQRYTCFLVVGELLIAIYLYRDDWHSFWGFGAVVWTIAILLIAAVTIGPGYVNDATAETKCSN